MTLQSVLVPLLEDPAHAYSLGVQGALAEFMRQPDEPCEYQVSGTENRLVSERGALSINTKSPLKLYAGEFYSNGSGGWRQALGLYQSAGVAIRVGRKVITDLGRDHEALIADGHGAQLFDLGLGIAHVDVCISSRDPAFIKLMQAHTGEVLFTPGSALLGEILKVSPRRIFLCAAARLEVNTPIPLDRSPHGPHTHLLADRLGLPEVNTCCTSPEQLCMLSIHPAHPCRDLFGVEHSFDAHRHSSFQTLLDQYGPAQYVEFKRHVLANLKTEGLPEHIMPLTTKTQRMAARLTVRQAIAEDHLPRDLLDRWSTVLESSASKGDK